MKKQTEMNIKSRGGKRKRAGRPREKSRGVAHEKRETVNRHVSLHVNFKYRIGVRNKDTLKLLKRSIQNARKHGLKVLHYAFMHNHVHLIVEAKDNETLTKGMRSLTITMAKGLQKGRVQIARYHLHVLRTGREVRNAIRYVLFNEQKHDSGTYSKISDYTSLLSTKGWKELVKAYVQKKRITVKVELGEIWMPDVGNFLFQKAQMSLT